MSSFTHCSAWLLLIGVTAPAALAAKPKADLPISYEKELVTIRVPESELVTSASSAARSSNEAAALDLRLSNWEPVEFTRPARNRASSKFRRGGLPAFSLNRLAVLQAFPGNGAGLFWGLGLSYVQLERDLASQGLVYRRSQSLSLISLRLSLEYQGPRFLNRVVAPYLAFSLLPTNALAPESGIEDRVSAFGLPYEVGAGFLFRPAFLKQFWSFSEGTLGLGFQATRGEVGGSDFRGSGIQGLFSVRI